jgi:hypothetical protein
MSALSPTQVAHQAAPSEAQSRALARLDELKRALQRQLNRRPTTVERCAMDRAALMTLRAEIAARDSKASSADVVRLDNAARRARKDFEALARLDQCKPKAKRSMLDIEKELRAHG